MAFSSKSSIHENFKYHVFLSFRGEDTRTNFVDYLYKSLQQKGIRTFRDNEGLQKGKRIDELFKAIEESKFFIIVFSKNYASSSWCLKELAKIMECQDGIERIAYPLFHDVDPSDIRKQSGPVGEAIAKHKTDQQSIVTWKKALEDSGNLVGWDIKKIANGHEAEAINLIVKEISAKIRSICLSKDDENLVGMESRMQDVESSLRMDLEDEVRMIGIWGMGGAGKTTLARAIYQKISSQFDGKSFVDNVREASKTKGLLSLQKQVIKDVFGDDNISSFQDAISMMKDRMSVKKVLLILDDVDHIDQLEALAGAWFKGGSRIIITTRNEQLLIAHGVNTSWIHDASLLSEEDANSLFSRYAFETYIPDEGFEELSSRVVQYAAGLPLTLKVLGSSLFGKEEHVWKDALKRLETIPCEETIDKLEISYDGLKNDQKEIFLDVACFLKSSTKEDAVRMLEIRGFHAITGLTVLEEQSLITINKYGRLGMHDSIQELGRNIVRREHPDEPNKHSRLWIQEEIEELLSDDEVTEATATCISTSSINLNSEIIMKGLRKLKNLRFFQISGNGWRRLPDNGIFDEDSFPNSLRFLKWKRYPGRCLPQTFRAKNLVGLELPYSKITELWESGEREVLKKLRFLNLSGSSLRSLDLGMTPNLERLQLYGCCGLTEIHAPAGCLKRLVYLNLNKCLRFKSSSSIIQQLESAELLSLPKLLVTVEHLRVHDNQENLYFECSYFEKQASWLANNEKSVSLDLEPGTKIESVSGSFFHLQHLRHVKVKGCIPELPNDLHQMTYLERLYLVETDIKSLPDNICRMRHLKCLKIKPCKRLEELPKDLGQLDRLEQLSVLSARITHVPDSICMLKNLKSLKLKYCKLLVELPRDLGQLECLEELSLRDCKSLKDIPNSICNMNCLEVLDIRGTGIRQLPQSIYLLEGLLVFGSLQVLQSCASATEIQTSEYETFCYIQAVNSTPAPTELRSLSTDNYLKRNFAVHESTKTKQVQEMQSSGVNDNTAANVSLPQQTTVALQSTQSKYVKVWEGNLSGVRQGQPVFITRLEGYRNSSASESLVANWPPTMQILRLISQDNMNNKQYVGKADILVFQAMSQRGFLGQLQERKLCAVIQLPSQTLLLSVDSAKAHRIIGILFPGDMLEFKSQISRQIPQQHPQLQQQMVGAGTGMNQGSSPDHEATDKVHDLNPHILEPTTNDVTGPTPWIVYKRRKDMNGTRVG